MKTSQTMISKIDQCRPINVTTIPRGAFIAFVDSPITNLDLVYKLYKFDFVVFHDQKLEQSFTSPLMLFHFCILDHCTNCLLNFFRAIVFFFALTSQSRSNRLMLKMILVGGINLFFVPYSLQIPGKKCEYDD
jgi:hypothetical protein